jgi:hypothetical protein
MKLSTLLLVVPVILCAGSALAEGAPGTVPEAGMPSPGLDGYPPNLTALQVSPMYLEIKQVLEEAALVEGGLLAELAAAADEDQCEAIIGRIENLDRQRDLQILRIQARYAEKAGRWRLEKQIRTRIAELEQETVLAVR